MKYLLLVHHNEDRFNTMPEGTRKDMLAESIQLCHQLDSKGQYIHASPLQPEATGAIVRVREGKSTVTDGPFMETKEQLAGYFLIEADHQTFDMYGAHHGQKETKMMEITYQRKP
ncbi:MAG: YciI family protein [Nitrospira sp.]|nr:YciI family protein [Nitrospira sp.]